MPNPRAKQPTPEILKAMEAYYLARAMAETLKPKVDAIAAETLAELQIPYDAKWTDGPRRAAEPGAIITDPREDYLMSADDLTRYCARLEEKKNAAGLRASKPGNCPYLEASSAQIRAENAILDAVAAHVEIPEIRAEKLHGENRTKALTLHLQYYTQFLPKITI